MQPNDKPKSMFGGFKIGSEEAPQSLNIHTVPETTAQAKAGSFGGFKMGQADKAVPASEAKSSFGTFSMKKNGDVDETAQE
jgi:hypothetical protein